MMALILEPLIVFQTITGAKNIIGERSSGSAGALGQEFKYPSTQVLKNDFVGRQGRPIDPELVSMLDS
jgi:hypothetical protein